MARVVAAYDTMLDRHVGQLLDLLKELAIDEDTGELKIDEAAAWAGIAELLKTGGLSQALLMAQVAQKKGLDLMVGCYSDSSLLNGAAAQMLPLIHWPDLDSHLNLVDDPFVGLELHDDRLRPSAMAGLGIRPAGGTAA